MSRSRFSGALFGTLVLAAAGVASGERALFVAATIPLAFVVYGALLPAPGGADVAVERSMSASSPLPGDRVDVTLTVRNDGDRVLSDVRVADGVPPGLTVVDGATEAAVALPPGDETTLEYTVVADRGHYPFEEPTVRLRSTSGAAARTRAVSVTGADALDCRVRVADIPLRRQTTAFAGTLPTDTGGPGIEFHSTRDYQYGDPVNRINWRRYAKTGDLSTVNYRERRAAAVVLAVDCRAECDVAHRDDAPSGASLSAYAAAQAVEPLERAGHEVGLAVFGTDDPVTGASDPAWVPPGTGDAHHARLATVLDAALAGDTDAGGPDESVDEETEWREEPTAEAATPDGGASTPGSTENDVRIGRVADRIRPGTQVVVCSPALDDFPVALARRLGSGGHRVTAVSPDVTGTDTPGRTLLAADRALTVAALRATGATVVDWSPDEPLASAVSRATTAVREGAR